MELSGNLPHAEYRRFESNREYQECIDRLIPLTQSVIRVFDKTLSQPWNSAARIQLLKQFLLASRVNRIHIVVHDTKPLLAECPRLLEFSQQFNHALKIRETLRGAKHVYDPFVVFDGSHYVHRFHYDHMRAAEGTHDANGAQQLIERFEEIQECAGPPLAANVTGL